jgi:hypothetical protein
MCCNSSTFPQYLYLKTVGQGHAAQSELSFLHADQVQRILLTLIVQMPFANHDHGNGHEQSKQDDDGINMHIEPDQQRIQ